MSLIDTNNLDWDAFSLGKSGRTIKLLYNKKNFQFCTSLLYTPFGVKSNSKDWSKFDEYCLDCSLNQSESEHSTQFRNFLTKLDEKINELVKSNKELLNITNENCEYSYNSILRENKNYPKLMKLQLPRDKNGNFDCFVFNSDKTKIKINEGNIEEVLTKGKFFKCIIECSKLWYFKEKVGSIWNIVQLKFTDVKVPTQSVENLENMENIYTNCMIKE
jgi:hypothetical protein